MELALAANYLDIRGLTEVTSKTLASMIKGKTKAEIIMVMNGDDVPMAAGSDCQGKNDAICEVKDAAVCNTTDDMICNEQPESAEQN